MNNSKISFFSLCSKSLLIVAIVFLYTPANSQQVDYYEDIYAALLSRMVEKGAKSDENADFLESTKYWSTLWNKYKDSNTWKSMMKNAQLFTKNVTEADGSTGKTYALVTISDRVAWLAFPGVSTDANLESGMKGKFIKWSGSNNTDKTKEVHDYYYQEWTKLRDGGLKSWLQNQKSNFDKLIVTGHSKGSEMDDFIR
ncbi:MAG: hypothetical protein AAFO07_30495 [Bacteroidota bacterium]